MKEPMSLQKQADALLQKAKEKGVSTNFFFVTTFKRYQVQMAALTTLEKAITDFGATVTKEYVKGRQNITVNPAITEYNKTSTAANGTVQTLINILKSFSDESGGTTLADAMRQLMDDE